MASVVDLDSRAAELLRLVGAWRRDLVSNKELLASGPGPDAAFRPDGQQNAPVSGVLGVFFGGRDPCRFRVPRRGKPEDRWWPSRCPLHLLARPSSLPPYAFPLR